MDNDLNSLGVGPSHWSVAATLLPPSGLNSGGVPVSTWGYNALILNGGGGGLGPLTFQVLKIPPLGQTGTYSISEAVVEDIEGYLTDVSDTCGSSVIPLTGSLVARNLVSFQIPPLQAAGQVATYAFGGGFGFVLDFNSATIGSSGCPCGAGYVTLHICVYLSQYDVKAGVWQIRDTVFSVNDLITELEYWYVDTYHLVNGGIATPYTGRKFPLRLPKPVRLCAGQALHVTVNWNPTFTAFRSSGFAYQLAPWFRTRYRVVS